MRRGFFRFALREKALTVTMLIVTLPLLLLTGFMVWETNSILSGGLESRARALAKSLARVCELPLSVGDAEEVSRLVSTIMQDDDVVFARVEDGDGNVMSRAGSEGESLAAEGVFAATADVLVPKSRAEDLVDLMEPQSKELELTGQVSVGLSLDPVAAAQWDYSLLSAKILLAAIVMVVPLALLIIGSWTRRLDRVIVGARQIAAGEFLDDSLSDLTNDLDDEIGQLARSFDSMNASLVRRDAELRYFNRTLQKQVRERTAELEDAKVAAENASRAKSEFLANMSHEIRTPLNALFGMIHLIQRTQLNATQAKYAALAQSSAQSLLQLINDVLDFSKIEAGKMELEAAEFDLQLLFEESVQMLSKFASSKGLELLCWIDPRIHSRFVGDPQKLRQILTNLLNNAIKFTAEGEVRARLEIEDDNQDQTTVRILVEDTGVGIPEERRDRLFKEFSQVDSSTTRRFGGTGLGLAICRKFVDLMGGEIDVESTPGEGSTFWFRVSLKKSSGRTKWHPLKRSSALVVCPSDSLREYVEKYMVAWGFRVRASSSCEDAIAAFRNATREREGFELVLLDLPPDAIREVVTALDISVGEEGRENVRLLALSQGGSDETTDELARLGVREVVAKPVQPSTLYDAIAGLLPTRDEGAVESLRPPRGAQGESIKGRVLVAEDQEVNQLFVTEVLVADGWEYEVAANGRLAFEAVTSRPFDVVLMDCQMPEMDGFEATRKIREAEARGDLARVSGDRLPIVALTANAVKGDREKCIEAGMDDYLTKPLDPDLLLRLLDAFCVTTAEEGSTAVSADAPMGSALGEPVEAKNKNPDDRCAIAFDDLLQRCMGNQDLMERLLQRFIPQLQGSVDVLRELQEGGEWGPIAQQAHKLKGMASNLSAKRLADLARELEALAREKQAGEVSTLIDEIECEAAQCLISLRERAHVS